jgi:ABC-2 type transport system permease protein
MKALAIVQANLVRAARDRTALFFSILLPLMLILVLGLTYGSSTAARVGIVDLDGGTLGPALLEDLRTDAGLAIDVRRYDSPDALRDAASRGLVQAGVVIPAGTSAALAAGGPASLTVVAPDTGMGGAIATSVDDAVGRQVALARAAAFAAGQLGLTPAEAVERARAASESTAGVVVDTGGAGAPTIPGGPYAAGAASQLILFMFLTSLTGATELVQTRQLGVSRRMFGTPTSMGTIVLGESLARIAFAMLQGLFIVVASALLFGVRWGDLAGVGVVIMVFGFVAGGAAMLVGGLAASPSQAGALGPAIGMLLGLLGGAMVPTEVFPEAMQAASRLTPHAWAMDALGRLDDAGASVVAILPQLAVLGLFAAAMFALASLRFRRVLRSGA